MILGFISLLLTFGQAYISKICIPTNYADSMLPCGSVNFTVEEGKTSHHPSCESVSNERWIGITNASKIRILDSYQKIHLPSFLKTSLSIGNLHLFCFTVFLVHRFHRHIVFYKRSSGFVTYVPLCPRECIMFWLMSRIPIFDTSITIIGKTMNCQI